MGLFGALNKALSTPTLGGITNGLVQDRRRAFAQNQYDEQKNREQAERDFASEFNKSIVNGDIDSATMLFDQFQGQLSPQTADSARREIQQIKSTQQQAQTQSENMRTMASAMAQGATAEEAQMLADAGRAGSGLDAIMGVRKNVQGREQAGKLDILKKLADASKGMTPGQQAQAYKSQGMEAPSGSAVTTPEDDGTNAIVKAIIKNPSLYDRVSSGVRDKVTPLLAQKGFEFPNPLNSADIGRISDYDTSLTVLEDLEKELKNKGSQMGPLAGRLGGMNPYNTEAQDIQASVNVTKQIVGKALEGGVLRAEDEAKYARILPTLNDTPEVAAIKIAKLRRLLSVARSKYVKNIREGKQDPSVGFDEIEIKEEDKTLASEGPKFNPQTGRYE